MTRNDLVFFGHSDWPMWVNFNHQPLTSDIDRSSRAADRYVIQLIGGTFEVYDLRTLRRFAGDVTIGIPVFTNEDLDAAMMWCTMSMYHG